MERKLFYKGKEINSEEAHKLPVEERVYLSGRKPTLEEKEKVVKEEPTKKKKGKKR